MRTEYRTRFIGLGVLDGAGRVSVPIAPPYGLVQRDGAVIRDRANVVIRNWRA